MTVAAPPAQLFAQMNRRQILGVGNCLTAGCLALSAITRDASGALWFDTDAGVSRSDGRRWDNVGRAQGLTDNHVYALAVQADGSVWAGRRGGVARLKWSANAPASRRHVAPRPRSPR
jgi:ligand-binding sensor domain-containing protein